MAAKRPIPESPWNWAKELVLVTGGSSGIGALVAQKLASKGTKVVILDLSAPKVDLGSDIYFYQCDVTDSAQIRKVAGAIHDAHGHPTVLVNNAGVGFGGTILDEPEENIRTTFAVNGIAQFLVARQFLPAMIERNHGHVVTIASIASYVTIAQNTDYSCTKAAQLAFHEGLRQELRWRYGAEGVRTSIIHPNWTRTPLVMRLEGFSEPLLAPEVVADAIVRQIRSGKNGAVFLPSWMSIVKGVRSLPSWLQEMIRNSQQHVLSKEPVSGVMREEPVGGRQENE